MVAMRNPHGNSLPKSNKLQQIVSVTCFWIHDLDLRIVVLHIVGGDIGRVQEAFHVVRGLIVGGREDDIRQSGSGVVRRTVAGQSMSQ